MQHRENMTVALAGNPNSGKTSIFNSLTGARQHVGNYPGVTVEKKEGECAYDGRRLHLVDLPGTYSLTAYSLEEIIARNFIIEERPDVVVDIVDASSLERNLYLATQFIELGVPLVIALNMSDVAQARGQRVDEAMLSRLLGCPVVPTVGSRGRGMPELLAAIVQLGEEERHTRPEQIDYGKEIQDELAHLRAVIEADHTLTAKYSPQWLALKLIERDEEIERVVRTSAGQSDEILDAASRSCEHLKGIFGEEPEDVVADRRYGFANGAFRESVTAAAEDRLTHSDLIDAITCNRVLGLPVFLGLMYLVFQLTFTLGEAPMGWIESLFGWAGQSISALWPEGSESALKSLLVDGVIGGVGGVLVFLPNIVLLFLAIAFLEDSGYMARAAFIIDRLMHKIGLHGRSFIPMLIGFGCNVPGIMATRTLESRRDRLTTILVLPLMSCGARLPIYALIIPAFFPAALHAPMLWTIYMIGIALAIICAKILRTAVFRGEGVPFVMELPPYRLPTLRGVAIHMWERAWLYVKKAGTVILGISVLMWAMTSYPKKMRADADAGKSAEAWQAESLAHSVSGRIGRVLEVPLRPLGFDWRVATALIGAFAAKEVFVAQLGIVYAIGEADEGSESLRTKLRENYTPLVGFCIMLFCLISAPCMATIVVTKRETNSWGWALAQLGGLTALAYIVTLVVYQAGSALGIGVG